MKFSIILPFLLNLVVPAVSASQETAQIIQARANFEEPPPKNDPTHPTFDTGVFRRQAIASYPAQAAHAGKAVHPVPAGNIVIDYTVKYTQGQGALTINGLTVNGARLTPSAHATGVRDFKITWLGNVAAGTFAARTRATFVYTIDGVTFGFGGSWTDLLALKPAGAGRAVWQSSLVAFTLSETVGVAFPGARLQLSPPTTTD